MGFISDISKSVLGIHDGQGADFQAPAAVLDQYIHGGEAAQQGSIVRNDLDQQQAFVSAIAQQGGLGNQANVYNQLQQVAQGKGPNPAQAALANATGANVANQAALMASQRGVGANPALLARQAAQQGANIQQNAAGQGAALQAQQSLGALGQLGNMANTQVGQQQQALQFLNQAAQNSQGQIYNALAAQNNSNVANAAQVNNNNSAVATQNAKASGALGSDIFKGIMDNVGKGISGGMGGGGGGGGGGMSGLGGGGGGGPGSTMAAGFASGGMVPTSRLGKSIHGIPMASGGKVPAMVSPGERYLPPKEVAKVAKGQKSAIKAGEKIKGNAKVKGDSYDNDTVHKTLKAGGIVLPRHVTQSEDPGKAAQDFVNAVLAKSGNPKK